LGEKKYFRLYFFQIAHMKDPDPDFRDGTSLRSKPALFGNDDGKPIKGNKNTAYRPLSLID
jgi:hypothetical protein